MKIILAFAAVATTLAAPASAQDRWDWGGGRPGDRAYQLAGRGVPLLDPFRSPAVIIDPTT